MQTRRHKLTKNSYARVREGSSFFLNIYCSKCDAHVVLYQKDGEGGLLRLYLDRIYEPAEIAEWQYLPAGEKSPNLTCTDCGTLIGTPMLYEAENRRAIRLVRGAFKKRNSDGTYQTR